MRKGEKMSEETKRKLSLSKKGKPNGRLGYTYTEETRRRMSEAQKGICNAGSQKRGMKGKTPSKETKDKMSQAQKKRYETSAHPRLGATLSPESLRKMSESHLGRTLSEETKKKLSEIHKGENHWNWQGGLSDEKHRMRSSREWKLWRTAVFERDEYTCQECGVRGGYLEPHHILPIRSDRSRLHDTKNGITLCRPCHLKTIWKEELFADKYFALTESK